MARICNTLLAYQIIEMLTLNLTLLGVHLWNLNYRCFDKTLVEVHLLKILGALG